jgi:hypothetical protein
LFRLSPILLHRQIVPSVADSSVVTDSSVTDSSHRFSRRFMPIFTPTKPIKLEMIAVLSAATGSLEARLVQSLNPILSISA